MSFRRGGRSSGNQMNNLPFGLGYTDVISTASNEFPEVYLPVNNIINSKERSLAVTYIKFAQTVKDGPFYTGSMASSIENEQYNKGGKRKITRTLVDEEGIMDGIKRYSDKYLKKRKIGTSIDDHPFHIKFFPDELHKAMGMKKNKNLKLSNFNTKDDIFTGGSADESKGLIMLQKLKELAEDIDEDDDEEQETNKEELGDDDFDDESEDDDYNAEKYFDDGDDDFGGEEEYGDEAAF